MNKILVTSLDEFIEHPSKKIVLEVPANNSLVIEIEKNGESVTIDIFALLK